MRPAITQPRILYPVLFSRFERQRKRCLGHFQFRAVGVAGNLCHPFAIGFAAVEVHELVGVGWVLLQNGVIDH